MSKIVVLGSGISGHTASCFLRKYLGNEHQITVVSPTKKYNWIPSNVWVGVGDMKPDRVLFDLEPIYKKANINFINAKATKIYPEGNKSISSPFVVVEEISSKKERNIEYDYLINATGPKLNFDATTGLGPSRNSQSICSASHAVQAWENLSSLIKEMKNGKNKTIVIGVGHGMATCQGAAFEYLFNVESKLKREKVRDRARIIYITNEYELGDFGMGGLHLKYGGYIAHSKTFTESLFAEREIFWIKRAHPLEISKNKIKYETLDGTFHELEFDFAMLIPPFAGVGLKAFNKKEEDITGSLFLPNGFMKVDGNYNPKPYIEWDAEDWPKTLQNPIYKNVFAIGIAFAPPHPISKPMQSPNKTTISPTAPRTGMPSAMMGKAVAQSIANLIKGKNKPLHTASMAKLGAACVASTGTGFFSGTAVSITVYPIVPDFKRFPEYGRDLNFTFGDIGLAGHWIKLLLHYAFIYKAKLNPFWYIIPE
ncbi:MAG: sulfide:quinone reductase [Thermodesulfobium narugense]|nr:MAG: sulfide:quinone reductase [Thermodesulfobium narugense]